MQPVGVVVGVVVQVLVEQAELTSPLALLALHRARRAPETVLAVDRQVVAGNEVQQVSAQLVGQNLVLGNRGIGRTMRSMARTSQLLRSIPAIPLPPHQGEFGP